MRPVPLLALLLLPAALFADKAPVTLEAAQAFEKEKKHDQAMAVYEEWLKEHPGDARFAETLRRCGDLKKNPLAAIELYKTHAAGVADASARRSVYREIAVLYALLGDYRAAILNFQNAFPDGGTLPLDDPWLAALPALCVAIGETDAAYGWVKRADPFLKEPNLRAELNYALLEIYLLRGDERAAAGAYAMIESAFPAAPAHAKALLRLVRLQAGRGEKEKAEGYLSRLRKSFPGSLEERAALRLLSGRKGDGPELAADARDIIGGNLFRAEEVKRTGPDQTPVPPEAARITDGTVASTETNTADKKESGKKNPGVLRIQVGSYTMRENAVYMARDLEKLGFKSEIVDTAIKGRPHFRVFVGDNLTPDEAQTLLAKLNDRGIGGYLFSSE